MVSLYATLTTLEAYFGIDFSAEASEWAPSDNQIYHTTNDSIISQVSAMINGYCNTTFSNHPSCDPDITFVCHEATMRQIIRRNALKQRLGHASIGDDFASFSGEEPTEFFFTSFEKELLNRYRNDEPVIEAEGG